MPARAVKERLAQDVGLWQADGLISAATADLLRRRYDVPGFGWATLFRNLGIGGGVLALFGILGLIGAMSESMAFGVVVLGGLAAAFLSIGVRMVRDPVARAPHAAKIVLALGVTLAAGAVTLLATAVHLDDKIVVPVVGLLVLPLTFALAYRYSITFLLTLGIVGFFHWVGSWTSMLGRSTYAVDVQDPGIMSCFALLAVGVGLLHEQRPHPRWPRFHHAYQAVGLTYLNLCLLILTIGSRYAAIFIVLFTLLGLGQIVAGARLQNGLFTGFGVTAFSLNLFTRFGERFWDALDAGTFFVLLGLLLFGVGVAMEWVLRRTTAGASPA